MGYQWIIVVHGLPKGLSTGNSPENVRARHRFGRCVAVLAPILVARPMLEIRPDPPDRTGPRASTPWAKSEPDKSNIIQLRTLSAHFRPNPGWAFYDFDHRLRGVSYPQTLPLAWL